MNIYNIIKVIAVFFILVTAFLLVLTIFDIVDNEATQEVLTKFALASTVVGGASILVSFLIKK